MSNKETITFDICPFPKPRMTQRDRWAKRPRIVKYHIFCDGLRHYASLNNYEVGKELSLTFIMEMPKSWSKKKRNELNGQPHTQRPDLDNLIKAFKDALCEDDSHVHTYFNMKKVWGEEGKIIITK